eukprot:m.231813 g.231813  ORF g.231813 m.231813 type:complete len:1627 (-) comp26471_c0_seq1:135-5015(-)
MVPNRFSSFFFLLPFSLSYLSLILSFSFSLFCFYFFYFFLFNQDGARGTGTMLLVLLLLVARVWSLLTEPELNSCKLACESDTTCCVRNCCSGNEKYCTNSGGQCYHAVGWDTPACRANDPNTAAFQWSAGQKDSYYHHCSLILSDCSNSFYKPHCTQGRCTACSACLQSCYDRASTIKSCPSNQFVVPATYKSRSKCQTCSACLNNQYKSGGCTGSTDTICTTCPANSVSRSSTSSSACKCISNYYDTSNGSPPVCVECPEHSTSPSGSTSLNQCVCNTGYFMSQSQCKACNRNCPENTYLDVLCSNNRDNVCRECPSNSFSEPNSIGIEACKCKSGYFDNDSGSGVWCNACSSCLRNQYRTGSCQGTTDYTCTACPDNSNSSPDSTSIEDCTCLPGFFDSVAGNGVKCQACKSCVASTYRSGSCEGETNYVCLSCPANSNSPPSATSISQCTCTAGFYDTNTAPNTVSCKQCSTCQVNQYTTRLCTSSENTGCGACPEFSVSPANSPDIASCTCQAGYFDTDAGKGVDCQLCSVCPVNTYISAPCVATSDVKCALCPQNSVSSKGSATVGDCECVSGFFDRLPANNAVDCTACRTCGINQYSSGVCGANENFVCKSCPAYSVSPAKSTKEDDCQCVEGFYKSVSRGNMVCLPCPTNSSSPASSTSLDACTCVDGFHKIDASPNFLCAPCQECETGSYKTAACTPTSPTQCTACPANSTSPLGSLSISDCKCLSEFFNAAEDAGVRCQACQDCKANEHVSKACTATTDTQCATCPFQSTSPAGSTSPADCVCNAGFYDTDHSTTARCAPCSSCSANTYRNGTCFGQTDYLCLACPTHSTSIAGTTTRFQCLCDKGYYGNGSCTRCPTNSATNKIGSQTLDDCECGESFYDSIRGTGVLCKACRSCGANRYRSKLCQGESDSTCSRCPEHSHSSRGSTSVTSCICDAGYKLTSRGNTYICEDVNECLTNNGGCQHNCTNELPPSRLRCFCRSGFRLSSDNKGCELIPTTTLPHITDSPIIDVVGVDDAAASVASSSSADMGVVVGSVVGGLVLLIIVVVILLFIRKRHNGSVMLGSSACPVDFTSFLPPASRFEPSTSPEYEVPVSRVPMEISRNLVTVLEVIGKGHFSTVNKATFKQPILQGLNSASVLVAVKMLSSPRESDRTSLLEEAALMCQFSCRRIVSLIGCVTVGEPLMLVMELLEYGALDKYLKNNNVAASELHLMAGDIAEAMAYLENLGFVHRDLACRNCLVASDYSVKLADFGLSRDLEEDEYYSSDGNNIPVRWTSPEALRTNKFTVKNDIWAYGVVLYELWTRGAVPYSPWPNNKVWVEVTENRHRLSQPEGCPDEVYEIMIQCWEENPEARPTFETLSAKTPSHEEVDATDRYQNASMPQYAFIENEHAGDYVYEKDVQDDGYEMPTNATYAVPTEPSDGQVYGTITVNYDSTLTQPSATYAVPQDDFGENIDRNAYIEVYDKQLPTYSSLTDHHLYNSTVESESPTYGPPGCVPAIGLDEVGETNTEKRLRSKSEVVHKKLNRMAAERKLKDQPNGTFLVRTKGRLSYAISVIYEAKVTHHLVEMNEDGVFAVNSKPAGNYNNLTELIDFLMMACPMRVLPYPLSKMLLFA